MSEHREGHPLSDLDALLDPKWEPPRRCKTCDALKALPADDAAKAQAALDDPDVPTSRITLWLKAKGHSIHETNVRTHRREHQ